MIKLKNKPAQIFSYLLKVNQKQFLILPGFDNCKIHVLAALKNIIANN
jgi:hypothetical protein